MQSMSTIGLDIAKSVFQVHGVDAAGQVVIRRQLRRRHVLAFFQKLPPCLVGIEACASSHHWSRELQALGHTVRLMPPAYDLRQAAEERHRRRGDLEAVTRPNMRFVPTKTVEQQSCLMLHRARHLFIRQQTAVINSIRAYLAEFGIVAPVGRRRVEQLLEVVADTTDHRLPEVARACLAALGSQLRALKAQILEFDRRIISWHRSSATSKRLDAIPGVGPALATALVASVADAKAFRSGRDFSAWVGLVPKTHQQVYLSFSVGKIPPILDGVAIRNGDIVLASRGACMHQPSSGECQWGLISLSTKELERCSKALIGRKIAPPHAIRILRPARADGARLQRLLRQACHLVEVRPKLVERPEVARALEQEMFYEIIHRLAADEADDGPKTRHNHAAVMRRFEESLSKHIDQKASMSKLCAEIGVAERTLRMCCAKFLSVSPTRYLLLRRLNQARSALRRAKPSIVTVAEIARNHQFLEFGRFAVTYRAVFGESPSVTLGRDW